MFSLLLRKLERAQTKKSEAFQNVGLEKMIKYLCWNTKQIKMSTLRRKAALRQ